MKQMLKDVFVAKFKETSGVTQDIYDDAFNDGKQEGIEQGKQEGLENAKNHLEEKYITKNGVYTATEPNFGFSKIEVRVDIPPDYVNPEGTVEITENGTYNVEHFEFAEVNVPIPDGYIKPSGTIDITEEGEFNVAQYETANVKMASSSVNPMQYYIDNNGSTPSCENMFAYWKGTDVTPMMKGLDTSKVKSMYNMFQYSNVNSLPYFDTSNVENMSYFNSNGRLTTFTGYNTSKVTTMSNMFYQNSAITEVSVDATSCTDISRMFYNSYGNTKLRKLKISNVSEKLTSTSQWLYNVQALEIIDFRGATGVPTLSETTSLIYLSGCKIIIPDELYDTWTTATNWTTFRGTWVKASEYVEE